MYVDAKENKNTLKNMFPHPFMCCNPHLLLREGFCSKEVFPDICVHGKWMQMIESEFQQEFMSGSLNTAMQITL